MSNGVRARGGRGLAAVFVVLVCSVLIAACAGTEIGEKGEKGEEIGSILGGILGPLVPGSSAASQILQEHGELIGGIIGGAIVAALDEEDREALAKTTHAAFETGKSQTYANKASGVRISAKVSNARANANGQPCRSVRQEVTLKNGKTASDTVRACRGPNGWKKA